MPLTRPASDLQRNISSIYELCHTTKEPVYITKNGQSDLVVMDAEAFDRKLDLQKRVYEREMKVYGALMKSEEDFQRGCAVDFSEIRRDK